jgi:hypothetical protein
MFAIWQRRQVCLLKRRCYRQYQTISDRLIQFSAGSSNFVVIDQGRRCRREADSSEICASRRLCCACPAASSSAANHPTPPHISRTTHFLFLHFSVQQILLGRPPDVNSLFIHVSFVQPCMPCNLAAPSAWIHQSLLWHPFQVVPQGIHRLSRNARGCSWISNLRLQP